MPQRKLFTIGYEGQSIASFLANLASHRIEVLLDVRDLPLSRKRGFSKNALAAALNGVGIEYVHLRGLGDPKPGRVAAREGRYADFRRIFGAHMRSAVAQSDLARAIKIFEAQRSCMMCYECDHEDCHRSIVASHVAQRCGCEILHISPVHSASALTAPRGNKKDELTTFAIG